jgi:Holliday junction resolvase RusA-like endonuclease
MQAIQKGGRTGLLKMHTNVPYSLHVAIFFDRVEIKKSSTGDRYAKMDISNRLKLIEDTVADAVGIDDRHNFRVTVEKHCDPQNPGLYITLEELSEKEVGLTKGEYDDLRQSEPDRAGSTSSTRRLLGGSSRRRSVRAD